jgi:hypothetical protein
MSLRAALKDRAYVIRPEADAEVVEGRRLFHDRASAPFRARLTLDAGAEGQDAAGTEATTQAPALLAAVVDVDRQPVTFRPGDRVLVESRDFTPGRTWAAVGTFQVDGEAFPIRRVRSLKGWQVRLKRVDEDNANLGRTS